MALNDMTPGGPASAATSAPGGAPSGVSPNPSTSAKIPEAQAGYMELAGAQKDGGCSKVDVQGGVSLDRGCCNFFEPQDEQTDTFSCGNCKYGSEAQDKSQEADTGGMTQESPGAEHPLQQLRAKPRRMAG
jgi:hypothetical protein